MQCLADSPNSRTIGVAFLTIGQAPRVDLVPVLLEHLPTGPNYQEFGALDDMSSAEIAAVAPKEGDDTLCSRLRDGSEVKLSKSWTHARLQLMIDRINADGFDVIVLLCTCPFTGLISRARLIDFQQVAEDMFASLDCARGHLSMIVPAPEQARQIDDNYGFDAVTFGIFSPYQDATLKTEINRVAKIVKDSDVIFMNCMGYSDVMGDELANISGVPVILARNAVISVLQDILQQIVLQGQDLNT